MPTYVYQCSNSSCENHQSFELVQKITETPLSKCPLCEAKVERLLTGGAFHLKGSGWYKTDYSSSSSSANGSKSSKSTSTEKKSESSSSESASSSSDSTTKKDSGGGTCGGGCSCH